MTRLWAPGRQQPTPQGDFSSMGTKLGVLMRTLKVSPLLPFQKPKAKIELQLPPKANEKEKKKVKVMIKQQLESQKVIPQVTQLPPHPFLGLSIWMRGAHPSPAGSGYIF